MLLFNNKIIFIKLFDIIIIVIFEKSTLIIINDRD